MTCWQAFLLLWLICPLVFFTFARNIIWTYALPVVPAMALLLADTWQNKWEGWPKRIIATAAITPVLMIGLTLFLMNGGGQKSQKQLMQVISRQAVSNPGILYLHGTPFSARFYSSGKAKEVSGAESLREKLQQAEKRYFLAAEDNEFDTLPPDIRSRFSEIARYRDWILYLENLCPYPTEDSGDISCQRMVDTISHTQKK